MAHTLFWKVSRLIITIVVCLVSCSTTLALTVEQTSSIQKIEVTNPLNSLRRHALVRVPISPTEESAWRNVVIFDGENLVPSERQNAFFDNVPSSLFFMIDLEANERKVLTMYSVAQGKQVRTPGKTYAELAVRIGGSMVDKKQFKGGTYVNFKSFELPSNHIVGNKLFKYEGIGWESDRVGYRFYFDNRSAIDVFGKLTDALVLANVGLDSGDYHTLDDWGMDILKVGNSVGLGAVAAYHEKKLIKLSEFKRARVAIQNSTLSSSADFHHESWKAGDTVMDVHSRYRIFPHHPLTEVNARSDKAFSHWATGIVNHDVDILTNHNKQQWCYTATYGQQSLTKDNLGMAIFFRCSELYKQEKKDSNIALLFNTQRKPFQYYFLADWAASPITAAKNIKMFRSSLDNYLERLNNPVKVNVIN